MTDTPTPTPPIVNIAEVLADSAFSDTNRPGPGFDATLGAVGRALGTRKIGATATTVAPGAKAWPRHYHFINDEMFVILAGTGTLHYGEADHPLKPQDVVHIEAGTGIAFQIENTGEAPLTYLALSTLEPADVFVYPDSGKIGFLAGSGPMRGDTADGRPRMIRFIAEDMKTGYWDGEV